MMRPTSYFRTITEWVPAPEFGHDALQFKILQQWWCEPGNHYTGEWRPIPEGDASVNEWPLLES